MERIQKRKMSGTHMDHVEFIASAINSAKTKTIARINKQLQRMSPNDVAALERLIGKR